MGRHGMLRRRGGGCAPARPAHRLVRARRVVRGGARVPRHALPAGPAQHRHRGCGARRAAQHRAARSPQPPANADGRTPPVAQALDLSKGTRFHMIMHRSDQALAIHALKNAAPYIRMYKGKTFVVKVGGGVFADENATRVLVEQIAILHFFGVRVVLVHGGGPQLTEAAAALGVPTRMVEGRRITDQKSIDVTTMVLNGLINTRILGICRDLNIEAVGISGVDAGLVRAHKRPPVKLDSSGELIDYGFVGDIDAVDPTVLKKLLDNGLMPVVSPLSADQSGTLLNINADTVAAAIGAALAAEKLILCTGAPGILGDLADLRSLISYTDLAGLRRLRESGQIADGMLPKAKAIEDAIRGGVRRVHVVSYQAPEGILGEVFTNEGTGTLIVADINALTPAEQQGAA